MLVHCEDKMATFEAWVTRPYWSTWMDDTFEKLPYCPAVTPLAGRFVGKIWFVNSSELTFREAPLAVWNDRTAALADW
jgi:hypothetical protein